MNYHEATNPNSATKYDIISKIQQKILLVSTQIYGYNMCLAMLWNVIIALLETGTTGVQTWSILLVMSIDNNRHLSFKKFKMCKEKTI